VITTLAARIEQGVVADHRPSAHSIIDVDHCPRVRERANISLSYLIRDMFFTPWAIEEHILLNQGLRSLGEEDAGRLPLDGTDLTAEDARHSAATWEVALRAVDADSCWDVRILTR
jgi:hypothetical protein